MNTTYFLLGDSTTKCSKLMSREQLDQQGKKPTN